jgi:phosphoribosylglycinamide formyltransferase-1
LLLEMNADAQRQPDSVLLARVPTAVFVSGSGTNLQAVIDAVRVQTLPLDLRLVISNKPHALALQRARTAGVPTAVFEFARNENRMDYAVALADAVENSGARLVLLLGWMHVFAPAFLERDFTVLNLHPAYLPEDPSADSVAFPDGRITPAFRGPHALHDAIAAGAPLAGASLIAITNEVDRGPLFARKAMALRPNEDEAAALERLHAVEQEVVREGVLRWIAEQPLR